MRDLWYSLFVGLIWPTLCHFWTSEDEFRLAWLSSHSSPATSKVQHHLKEYLQHEYENDENFQNFENVNHQKSHHHHHRAHPRRSKTKSKTREKLQRVFRHPNKLLDRLEGENFSVNVSTISELLVNLREMRGRGRRSNNNHNGHNNINNMTLVEMNKKGNMSWPLKKVALIEGDIWLGGLMMVHERQDEIICGPIMPQGGIQALETMLYTIDQINDKADFLPGIKIGAHILDDCDKDTYGLEQAVDFIKGSISNIDEEVAKCSDGESPVNRKHNVIAGVVGAASSVTSIQVANLLRLFKIPQVSFFSTSPELSNKQRFEYFSRTIPSDKNQVQAMVEILKTFGWTYVSIIYEESNYGIKAFEELEKLLPENNICIATKEKLVKDSGVAGEAIYERIVDKLLSTHKAKGVVVFGSDQEVKDLMRAVGRRNLTGHFSWIGSDGWSGRSLVSDGNEAVVEGTLSVQPKANPVKGFDKYFFSLNVKNNTRNPWFVEFWEHHWECKFPNSSRTPFNLEYGKMCTGDELLSQENTAFEDQLQYVSDAVLTFAYAFRDMHRELCKGKSGLCPAMNPIDGTELLNYLRKVKFLGLSGDDFHFDEWQDGPARYNIIHFRRKENSSTYHWVRVGEYNEGLLTLNMSAVRFADGSSRPSISVCSEPCLKGEAKQYFGGDTCCWSCIKCLNEYIVDPSDESICVECPMGALPNEDHTRCVPIKETYLRPSDAWAIGAMTFAGVGCILTAAIIFVFILNNETPVVRASSRELSYVILAGLFACFALTFLFIIRPNDWICGIQQFVTGLVFTVVYAALLTKTNRIARIFQAGRKSAKRPSFISPRSQLFICAMISCVQMVITGMWMLVERPKASYFYPTRGDNFLVCEAYINHSYVVAFFYPLLIIFVCTVYAVLTRKIPGDFNESKCIGFTMYTTCIIWLAFVPIYFSTGTQVAMRVTSMTVAISLSAYVMIVCLFGPKLYIILCHPERNVRQSMMAPSARIATLTSAHSPATPSVQLSTFKNHVDSPLNKVVRVDASTQFDEAVGESEVHENKVVSGQSNVIHPSESCGTQTEDEKFVGKLRGNGELDSSSPNSTLIHRISFKREPPGHFEQNQNRNAIDGRVQILLTNDSDVML